MKEIIDMRGQLTLLLTDKNGRVVHQQHHKNRIVLTGRQLVAEMFGGVTSGVRPTQVTHMGVGTDGTTPTDDDPNLLAPRDPRKPIEPAVYETIDETDPETGETIKRVRTRLTAVFDFSEANGPEPLREAAILNAESGGVMYNRVVFDEVTKTDAFKLTLLWDVVF